VGSVQHVFHHVVIKIRQLFLWPAACLTSTLLGIRCIDYSTNINFTCIIISLLMSQLLGPVPQQPEGQCPPYGLHIKRTGHNPPRRPSASWWVLTTVNTAGTNGSTCLPKHGGARDNKFSHVYWHIIHFRLLTHLNTNTLLNNIFQILPGHILLMPRWYLKLMLK
jgi:hypothetical protein